MSYYGGTTTDFGTVFTEDFVRTAVARPLPGGGALAVWSVPNEEGFAEYRLQRRGGDGWTTVGSCPAGGGTAGSYALADPNGKEGSTYRLVAVKASGATLADDQAFQAK